MFTMTKTHKEIAVFMTAQAENNQLDEKMFIKVKIITISGMKFLVILMTCICLHIV